MDENLLRKYLKYANTDEAFAVLFVKKHVPEAKGYWVEIIDCNRYHMSPNKLHFKFVRGALYQRTIKPRYPAKSEFTVGGKFDERRHSQLVRAITWETAHKDIEQQKSRRKRSRRFKITGVSYDKNRENKNFFRSDAPPEIQALAKNLSDRTNPLWDKALKYANKPEFVFEIKKIQVEKSDA